MMELNRDKFRKWLEGHRPRQVVGHGCDICRCPVAQFLKRGGESKAGALTLGTVSVRPSNIGSGRYSVCGEQHNLPRWANKFAIRIDNWCSNSPATKPRITASRALKILDGIEQ